MKKRLVLFLWFASASAIATSIAPWAPPQFIKEQELKNPDFIVNWLTNVGPTKADEEDAKNFFSLGLKAQKSENWSGASKIFAESMIRYPDSRTLFEYTYSHLRMLGEMRARKRFSVLGIRGDMEYALRFYETSLAANGVTKTLSPQEIQDIEQYISCLKTYLRTSRPQTGCPPTVYFADGKIRKDANLPTKETTN
jgi:hypothetical protein